MVTIEFALRDEIGLTYGRLPVQYSNQIILCKKAVFTRDYAGPF